LAGGGILIGMAYTLRVLQKAFFGDVITDVSPQQNEEESAALSRAQPHPLEPISIPERIGAVILMATTLVIGLYPRLLLDLIVSSFSSPLFEGLRKGGLF
jgi:NADH-quinone oxidoreductase subunit M